MSKDIVFKPSKTTHWKNLFPKKMLLLGSQNLNKGEELIAQIDSVSMQKIVNQNGDKEMVPVCKFTNAPPMVLNVTNCKTISCLYGDSYENWSGKYIQIYSTEIKAFGKKTAALRVKQIIPDKGMEADAKKHELKLKACKSIEGLQKVFMEIPKHLKPKLTAVKNEMKGALSAKPSSN